MFNISSFVPTLKSKLANPINMEHPKPAVIGEVVTAQIILYMWCLQGMAKHD